MPDPRSLLLITFLVFFVASLYSSVGHKGASGYLAVLSFFAVASAEMSSTALLLNVLVSSGELSWPFVVSSVPLAFLGGTLSVPDKTYFFLLAAALLVTAVSAVFIFVNSLSGLAGRFTREAIVVGDLVPLVLAAFLGGFMGSYDGANKCSGILLRRLLAVVLLVAAGKLVFSSL